MMGDVFDPESVRRYIDRNGFLYLHSAGDWVHAGDYDKLLVMFRELESKYEHVRESAN